MILCHTLSYTKIISIIPVSWSVYYLPVTDNIVLFFIVYSGEMFIAYTCVATIQFLVAEQFVQFVFIYSLPYKKHYLQTWSTLYTLHTRDGGKPNLADICVICAPTCTCYMCNKKTRALW